MFKITDDDFDLDFAAKQESQFLVKADYFDEEMRQLLSGESRLSGSTLPWGKTYDFFRFRPGETTIWAGYNGHGKSMVSGQCALWMAASEPVVIASLEMPPRKTFERMLRQATGLEAPTYDDWCRLRDWRHDNIIIYDQQDSVDPERILAMIHYSAQELGATQIFIDSLVKCGMGGHKDNAERQSGFMDRLCWAAKSENVHIHVVHHMRKQAAETVQPNKFDVKGAGELTDLTDNLLVMWRNKTKEAEKTKAHYGQVNEYNPDDPDAKLTVHKQRHGEWEGEINLWFQKESQAYLPDKDSTGIEFPWGEYD